MDDSEITDLLKQAKTIAVVGFSPKAHRPSYFVARFLQAQGYRVLPINPLLAGQQSGLPGEEAYSDLATAREKTGLAIDIVDVFRRSEYTPEIARQAAGIRASCVWLQQGILNDEVVRICEPAGVKVVMDACLKTEHQRLMASL